MKKLKAILAIIRCDSMFVVTRRGWDFQEFMPGPLSLTVIRAQKCCQRLREDLKRDLAEASAGIKDKDEDDGIPWNDIIRSPA